jgi:hypothetical protein
MRARGERRPPLHIVAARTPISPQRPSSPLTSPPPLVPESAQLNGISRQNAGLRLWRQYKTALSAPLLQCLQSPAVASHEPLFGPTPSILHGNIRAHGPHPAYPGASMTSQRPLAQASVAQRPPALGATVVVLKQVAATAHAGLLNAACDADGSPNHCPINGLGACRHQVSRDEACAGLSATIPLLSSPCVCALCLGSH